MLENLQDFFENNALDEVREKLESYNIEFTNSNIKEGKFIINENGNIDIIFDADYKPIYKVNYYNPFPLLNKHKCKYSFIYDDNDYIELKIKNIQNLYKNKCGDKICINALYCNFHKNYIKYIIKYNQAKKATRNCLKARGRDYGFTNMLLKENYIRRYLESKIINLNEITFKIVYYNSNLYTNNIYKDWGNMILKIGK